MRLESISVTINALFQFCLSVNLKVVFCVLAILLFGLVEMTPHHSGASCTQLILSFRSFCAGVWNAEPYYTPVQVSLSSLFLE